MTIFKLLTTILFVQVFNFLVNSTPENPIKTRLDEKKNVLLKLSLPFYLERHLTTSLMKKDVRANCEKRRKRQMQESRTLER